MTYGNLDVNSWVGIHNGCDFTCKVHDSDGVNITVSGKQLKPFEFFIEPDALRTLLERAGTALAELDDMAKREQTGEDPA